MKHMLLFAYHDLPVGHLMYCPQRLIVACTTLRKTLSTLLDVGSKRSATARTGSWFATLHRNARICFCGAMTGRPDEFLICICPVCIISREKSSQVSLVMRNWNNAWIRRENIQAEFAQNNLECELNFCAWSSIQHLKQSVHHCLPNIAE